MHHPYEKLPATHFWRKAVSDQPWSGVDFLPNPKFTIGANERLVTAGSCFAGNIVRYLRANGRDIFVAEPAHPVIPLPLAKELGYGQFSARYGNIYTTRQLLELFEQATARRDMIEDFVTEGDNCYDLLRPGVPASGFSSVAEAQADRAYHLGRCRIMFESADTFIFTLGLTEAWRNRELGYTYPVCPGTVRGRYDENQHVFINYTFAEVHQDLTALIQALRQVNPHIKFIFTVSPVPLVASHEAGNVLVASSYSKSVLRAVCGEIARQYDFVDYFPAYEIISSVASRGQYLESDLRNVKETGIEHVMSCFFSTYFSRTTHASASNAVVASEPSWQAGQASINRSVEAQCEELYNDPLLRS